VISDILMPNLNGYALVARLRAKWPKVPVILMTGFLSQDAAKSMMNGSVDFIPKPINSELLIQTIQRLERPRETSCPLRAIVERRIQSAAQDRAGEYLAVLNPLQ
jgi:DNA-binding NtrC family response regulator